MSATRVLHEPHKCDTIATLKRVRHWNECDTATVKNFDFDNETSKNIFSHPYIYYMVSERLQGEEQFHSKYYRLEMPLSYTKMCLKSAP